MTHKFPHQDKPLMSGLPDISQEMEVLHASDRFKVFVAGGRVKVGRNDGGGFFEYVGTYAANEGIGQALVEILKEKSK